MSKRLFVLLTVVLMLAAFSVAQAQQPTVSGASNFVLTEAQINADFRIPSTATRRISNLDVDVKEDGVYVSFQVTVNRNGTSNTYNIIAILIGLFDEPRITQLELQNAVNRNSVVPSSVRDEVSTMLLRSWNNYEATVLVDLPVDQVPTNGIIMRDGGICNPRWGC